MVRPFNENILHGKDSRLTLGKIANVGTTKLSIMNDTKHLNNARRPSWSGLRYMCLKAALPTSFSLLVTLNKSQTKICKIVTLFANV